MARCITLALVALVLAAGSLRANDQTEARGDVRFVTDELEGVEPTQTLSNSYLDNTAWGETYEQAYSYGGPFRWLDGSYLAQHGVQVEGAFTQFYQGVASGGRERTSRYGGRLDVYVAVDTEAVGLWRGGKILGHIADWQFGQNAIADANFLSPVNTAQVFPQPNESFAVTNLLLQQDLGNGYAAMIGRYNLLDLWKGFFPDYGNGLDGFMNVSLITPFNFVIPTLPTVSNVAGIVKAEDRGLKAGFLVLENQAIPTTVGLNFPNGVTLVSFVRQYTEVCGLGGSHLFGATYGTGDFTELRPNGWIVFPPGIPIAPILGENQGAWSAAYIGEQRVWADPCDASRYAKIWGYLGFADSLLSPYDTTAGMTFEVFGPFADRPADRMGVGYFYNSLSNGFKDLLAPADPRDNVQGGEVYYNAALTDWFQLSVDVQSVRSTLRTNDASLVLGLRGKVEF